MHTRCPDCQTVFLITEQQLGAAGGKARCGRCGTVFDARAALLPESDALTAPKASPEAAPEPAPEPAPGPVTEPGDGHAPADEPIPAVLLEDFEQQRRARGQPRHGWAWTLAIALLTITLAVQYAYFMRAELVNRYPETRPWLMRLCSALSHAVACEVPFATDLAALRMLSSEVSEHPQQRDALLIQATFVNTAPFTQPYPLLEVKLADLRGNPVALRRFQPAEYLRADVDPGKGMAPRTPVTGLIEVARPFADVNSYRFAFYPANSSSLR